MEAVPGDGRHFQLRSVLLTAKAHAAMLYAAGHTGDRPIDVLNRALIVYAHLVDLAPGQVADLEITDQLPAGGQSRRLAVWRRRNRRGQ